MKPIYLDYNATTPLDKEVKELMIQIINEDAGNPASSNFYGVQAKQHLETARKQVADLIGCDTEEIIFTSGGTEANNIALRGSALALRSKGNHIITSSIEHPAVSEVCICLEATGYKISNLPVDEFGIVIVDELERMITDETILISVMHSNNETGSLQPIAKIAEIVAEREIIVHTDAAQSIGKVEINVEDLGVHLMSIAGHKFYAPEGVGALYVKKGTPITNITFGAAQEKRLRPGTQNLIGIAAMGKAAEIVKRDLSSYQAHLSEMRDRLYDRLRKKLAGAGFDHKSIKLNGHPDLRLANTLNISFLHIDAISLSSLLFNDVAFSCGAACHSKSKDSSKVLEAMQVAEDYAKGAIRLSTGKQTTAEEIDAAADKIAEAVEKIMLVPGSYDEILPSCPATSGAISCEAMKAGEDIASSKEEEIKLTQFTAGLGCACKLEPSVLEAIVKQLPVLLDEKTLVGPETSDDAAVYKIDEDKALVLTLDFFNPIVDDPRQFGAIAAANSLSDIYAMGATPLFALNIVGFPIDRLPAKVLSEILAGAIEKTNEAGIPILGGHTIKDVEPKYGLAVAGIVHPDKVYANNRAVLDNAIILTKPLGIGIITSALKKGIASQEQKDAAIKTMSQLNKYSADILKKYPVNCCTDITGFGLLGHLAEVVNGSSIEATINLKNIPKLDGLYDLIAKGVTPGGIFSNMEFHGKNVIWAEDISDNDKYILFDAQTSGGLLIFMPQQEADKYVAECRREGLLDVSIIGKVTSKGDGRIVVNL